MPGKIAVVVAALAASAGCYVEPSYGTATYAPSYEGNVDTSYATDGYTEPPPEYVATVQPVYYGGRANYYYNNGWRYHEGGRWTGYRGGAPEGLRQLRPQQRGGYSTQHRYEGGGRGGSRRGR